MKMKSESSPAKKKRRLLGVLTVFILLCSMPFVISGAMCASVQDQIVTAEEASALSVDCVLVLGARVWENGSPSGILEDRLITGISAYKSGASDRLLMSGDHGRNDYDEVNAMKTYAIEQGIPSANVFMDHAGFSTYESLYRARDIFQVKSVLIVTQEYHLYRALFIAKQMGLEAYGLAADLHTYSGMPMFVAREILARNKDFFYTLFMPEPTYLGEQIPIWSDGDLTNG